MTFRVLVCGGRDYNNATTLFKALDKLAADRGPIDILIHGAQTGADQLADTWGKSRGIQVIAVPAEWYRHGTAAGPIRNRRMIIEHAPQLVVAFPGNKGTANMIRQAKAAGIEVIEYE